MTDVGEQAFNGPLETGIRTTAILIAAYPRSFDLQRLVAFDYLISRTGQFANAPNDLHPPTPIKAPPTEVRRRIVQDALNLMLSRKLVERQPTERGIEYIAGEAAEFLMSALCTPYTDGLRERASWLVEEFGELDAERFDVMMRSLFEQWAEEFEESRPTDESTTA
jgi:hypothetical protein